MAQDWTTDVKRFDANADDGVIDGIVKYCGIALQTRDGQLVAFKDPEELDRVRESYLKKKLGLTHSDDELDGAIAAVGEEMKGVSFKNRVTVYYLLAKRLGMLHIFGGAAGAAGGMAAAGAAGAAALGIAGLGASGEAEAAPVAAAALERETYNAPAAEEPSYAVGNYADDEDSSGGLGWLWWLLGALVLLGLIWWLFFRGAGDEAAKPAAEPAAATATETAPAVPAAGNVAPAEPAAVDPFAGAVAEGTAPVPNGAGVTTELRDGKPVAKVYFDTAKTDVAPAFTEIAGKFKAYLEKNKDAKIGISGFNDPRGDAAKNAELSKSRAQAVQAEMVKAGIAEASTELVKPEATTQGAGNDAAARRVEVYIR